MKTCSRCKVEQDESGFHKHSGKKDGLTSHCKNCRKVYSSENKEALAEYSRSHYWANKERASEKNKAYCEANRESVAKNKKKWYAANRGLCHERCKEYRKKRLRTDHAFRCRYLASRLIHQALSRGGHTKGGRTFDHLPYTPAELSEHLLSTLQDGYTEADFLSGALHIDHIFPHSLTPYDSLTHPNFQKAWALSNLRLITAEHNIAKKDKIEIVNEDGTLSFISYEQYLTLQKDE